MIKLPPLEVNFIKKRDGTTLGLQVSAVIDSQFIDGLYCLTRLDRLRTEYDYWVQLRYGKNESLLNYMVFGAESGDDAIWTAIFHNNGDVPLTSAALKRGGTPEAAVAYDGSPQNPGVLSAE